MASLLPNGVFVDPTIAGAASENPKNSDVNAQSSEEIRTKGLVNTGFNLMNTSVNLQYIFMDIIRDELIVTQFTIWHQRFVSTLQGGLVS
jgi:hypothetical protein